ncbi:replication-relaxation family protein [Streptomyces sp. NPDC057325]|uniref:replication-relaxation family protein n=1 Tax=unclassified Streptomyces TaxID=2593676 RepID=UPI00362BF77F
MSLPATGTWNAPGKGGAQADLVLTAPQDGVPLLFIEVDNCHETAEELADKLEKYAQFFRRKVKDTDGRERPMWRTRWTAPEGRYETPHPPVLLVFNRIGERNPNRTVPRLMELTRHLWQGERLPGGHHLYDRKIPIIAVGRNQLREHGPVGPVFARFGRSGPQTLLGAIDNPRREAADAREQEEAKVRAAQYQAEMRRAAQEQAAKQAAEREARRPVCAGCGAKFTDARWEAVQPKDWGATKDSHLHLRDDCKAGAVVSPATGTQERQEPVRGAAGAGDFWPAPERPVCTECGAARTDERWKATKSIGWTASPAKRPTLYGDCDQRFEADLDKTWGVSHRQEEPDQEQAVPKQKALGRLSRLRG